MYEYMCVSKYVYTEWVGRRFNLALFRLQLFKLGHSFRGPWTGIFRITFRGLLC